MVGVVNDSDVVGGASGDVCIGESCEACDVTAGDDVEGAESGRGGAGAPATAER